MAEWEDKLENILSNPQAMEQIMSLARSLEGNGSSPAPSPSEPPSGDQQIQQAAPSSAGLLDGLSQLDPKMLSVAAKLMSQANQGDDHRTALLQALRPFVKEARYAKLDKAIQIAKLSRLIRMGLELFRAKEDSHV